MLLIDTREKNVAIGKITAYMSTSGIQYDRTKLYIGDYQYLDNPKLVVDRKQSIAELAQNCTSDSKRFKAELERAKAAGVTIVILVEQNRYKDRDRIVSVNTISDLILWEPKYGVIRGEEIFRILSGWVKKYPIRIEFCDKEHTGERIIQILNEGRNGKKEAR